MHFDWTISHERKTRVAESLISCGFLGHVSLFDADNVHARFADSREAVDGHARIPIARTRDFQNALFLPLIAANSAVRGITPASARGCGARAAASPRLRRARSSSGPAPAGSWGTWSLRAGSLRPRSA